MINKVIEMGRLVRDPEVRYTQDNKAIARFSIAVDRRFKRENEQDADFFPCVAFGKLGEFAEKYLKKGTKIVLVGRLQQGSYTNRDGQKVYTTDIIVEEMHFAESKGSGNTDNGQVAAGQTTDGFMNIPDGIDEELPFA